MIEPIDINTPALLVSSPCSAPGQRHPKLPREAHGEGVSPPALKCGADFQREYLPPVTCALRRYLGRAEVICVS